MDLAVYITGEGWGILQNYPIPKSSIYGIFETFSLKVSQCNILGYVLDYITLAHSYSLIFEKVWIALLVSMIAMICYVYMVVILKRKWSQLFGNYFTRLNTLGDTFMCTLGTMTNQGNIKYLTFLKKIY